jgi:hypothetical protein
MKKLLIEKFLERTNDMELQEQLELVRLDIYQIVEEAIQAKLETMSEEQILELI